MWRISFLLHFFCINQCESFRDFFAMLQKESQLCTKQKSMSEIWREVHCFPFFQRFSVSVTSIYPSAHKQTQQKHRLSFFLYKLSKPHTHTHTHQISWPLFGMAKIKQRTEHSKHTQSNRAPSWLKAAMPLFIALRALLCCNSTLFFFSG